MGFFTVVLLVILFFFDQSTGQNTSTSRVVFSPPDLPTRCPWSPNGSDVWWMPLQINHRHDPCSLFNHLSGRNNHRRDNKGGHLTNKASSLQKYNIMSACMACNRSPNTTTTPSAEELHLPGFPSGTDEAPGESKSLHDLPRWTNTTLGNDGIFNITQAVQVAISDNNISSVIRPNAGAIAGGVIGGFVLISLIFIAFLVVRRRRLKAQIAPSAEFIAGVGPRATYNNVSPNDSFLAFESGEWRDPVREMAYHPTTPQRGYNGGYR